ncbi:MAG: hypothetical protein J6Z08_01485 [Elusimicrobiales bacterium]|nr:hypothetical protein [Elusimicrobiales bacterium]
MIKTRAAKKYKSPNLNFFLSDWKYLKIKTVEDREHRKIKTICEVSAIEEAEIIMLKFRKSKAEAAIELTELSLKFLNETNSRNIEIKGNVLLNINIALRLFLERTDIILEENANDISLSLGATQVSTVRNSITICSSCPSRGIIPDSI